MLYFCQKVLLLYSWECSKDTHAQAQGGRPGLRGSLLIQTFLAASWQLDSTHMAFLYHARWEQGVREINVVHKSSEPHGMVELYFRGQVSTTSAFAYFLSSLFLFFRRDLW